MKEIKKEEMRILIEKNIIHNSRSGFVDRYGKTIGFYSTRNKQYIEDKYVDIAKRFL